MKPWKWYEVVAVCVIVGYLALHFIGDYRHNQHVKTCQTHANQIHDTNEWLNATLECHK